MKEKIYFYNKYPCFRRLLDQTNILRYLKYNGCKIVGSPDDAEYIFINTCIVTEEFEHKSLADIKRFANYKGQKIVVGCLPGIARDKIENKEKFKCLPAKEIEKIDSIFPDNQYKFSDIKDPNFIPEEVNANNGWHQWGQGEALLRICSGCNHGCSYCSIRLAIGELRSKPLKECVAEYKKLLDGGIRKFMFLGDNVGAYGTDISSSLAELFDELSKIDSGLNVKWSIFEINPAYAIKYKETFLRYLQEDKIISMVTAIQSGSPRILKMMNRLYDAKKIAEIGYDFKKINPSFDFRTEIIIGFPSETMEDFLQTLNLIKKAKFDSVTIYLYIDRPEAPAYNFLDKISELEKIKRANLAKVILNRYKIKYYYD